MDQQSHPQVPKDWGPEGENPFQLSPQAVPLSSFLYDGVFREKVAVTYNECGVTRSHDLFLVLTFINLGLIRL